MILKSKNVLQLRVYFLLSPIDKQCGAAIIYLLLTNTGRT